MSVTVKLERAYEPRTDGHRVLYRAELKHKPQSELLRALAEPAAAGHAPNRARQPAEYGY